MSSETRWQRDQRSRNVGRRIDEDVRSKTLRPRPALPNVLYLFFTLRGATMTRSSEPLYAGDLEPRTVPLERVCPGCGSSFTTRRAGNLCGYCLSFGPLERKHAA